jgi:MYXO-CTERM domain-containing protein
VAFETDLGSLDETVERDPLTGRYRGTLRAPREGGIATVRVVVEDQPGPTTNVEFVPQGCTCAAAGGEGQHALWLLGAALVFLVRRKERRNEA